MVSLRPLVEKWEPVIFPTRTFFKEAVYWGTLLSALMVLLVHIYWTYSKSPSRPPSETENPSNSNSEVSKDVQTSENPRDFVYDLLEDNNYFMISIIFLAKHILYLLDTLKLKKQKIALILDMATNALNIFVYFMLTIWQVFRIKSGLWFLELVGALKLAADLGLFGFFVIYQKRYLSVGHMMTVSQLLIDLQLLFVLLHFEGVISKSNYSAQSVFYEFKLVFMPWFVISLVGGLFLAPLSLFFAYKEHRGEMSTPGVSNKFKATQFCVLAVLWVLILLLTLILDKTLGVKYSKKQLFVAGLFLLAIIVLTGFYAFTKIKEKKKLRFLVEDTKEKSKTTFKKSSESEKSKNEKDKSVDESQVSHLSEKDRDKANSSNISSLSNSSNLPSTSSKAPQTILSAPNISAPKLTPLKLNS